MPAVAPTSGGYCLPASAIVRGNSGVTLSCFLAFYHLKLIKSLTVV